MESILDNLISISWHEFNSFEYPSNEFLFRFIFNSSNTYDYIWLNRN